MTVGLDTTCLMQSLDAFRAALALGFAVGTIVGALAVLGYLAFSSQIRLWQFRRSQ